MKRFVMRMMPAIFFLLSMSLMSCSLTGLSGASNGSNGPPGAGPGGGCLGAKSGVCDTSTTYWDSTTLKCLPLSNLCGAGTTFANGQCVNQPASSTPSPAPSSPSSGG